MSATSHLFWTSPWRYGGFRVHIGPLVLVDQRTLPSAGCYLQVTADTSEPFGPEYPAWTNEFGMKRVPPDQEAPLEEVRRVWYAAKSRVSKQWCTAIAGTIVPSADVDDDIGRRYYNEQVTRKRVEADRALAHQLATDVRARPARELDQEVIDLLTKLATIDGDDWVSDGLSLLALKLTDQAKYEEALASLRRRAKDPGPSEWEFWGD